MVVEAGSGLRLPPRVYLSAQKLPTPPNNAPEKIPEEMRGELFSAKSLEAHKSFAKQHPKRPKESHLSKSKSPDSFLDKVKEKSSTGKNQH